MSGIPAKAGFDETTRNELAYWRARGFTQAEAAARAGVPESSRLSAYFRTAAYKDDIRKALHDRLELTLAPKAIGRLEGILDDKTASVKAVVDASKAVLDRSGYGATRPAETLDGKDPHTMTPDELASLIERLEREKSERATLVGANTTSSESMDIVDFLK